MVRSTHYSVVRHKGQLGRKRLTTKGPIQAITTTTKDRVAIDEETRNISLWMDESDTQTRRILAASIADEQSREVDLDMWHEVQRLVKRRSSTKIKFPEWFEQIVQFVNDGNLAVRRYFKAFLVACRVVALFNSFCRRPQELPRDEIITVKVPRFCGCLSNF